MEEKLQQPDQKSGSVVSHRKWTLEDKKRIVQETQKPGVTISGVARAQNIPVSMIFRWKRELATSTPKAVLTSASNHISQSAECRSALTRIAELDDLLGRAIQRLSSDLKSNHGSSYNLACALSGLVQATSKLEDQRKPILEKLRFLEQKQVKSNENEIPLEVQRRAEYAIVRLLQRYPNAANKN